MTVHDYDTAGAKDRLAAIANTQFQGAADPIIVFVEELAKLTDVTTATKVKALLAEGEHLELIWEALLAKRDLPLFHQTGTLPRVSTESSVVIDELTRDRDSARNDLDKVREELEAARRELATRTRERDDANGQLTTRTRERDDARRELATRTRERDEAQGKLTAADRRATDAERDRDTKVRAAQQDRDTKVRDAQAAQQAAERDRDTKVRTAQAAQQDAERKLRDMDQVTGPLNAITNSDDYNARLDEVIAAANGRISVAEQQRYRTALRDISGALSARSMLANQVRKWFNSTTLQVLRDVLS